MIGRCGERGSGISVLAARHDDDLYPREFYRILQKEKIQELKNNHLYTFFFCFFLTHS